MCLTTKLPQHSLVLLPEFSTFCDHVEIFWEVFLSQKNNFKFMLISGKFHFRKVLKNSRQERKNGYRKNWGLPFFLFWCCKNAKSDCISPLTSSQLFWQTRLKEEERLRRETKSWTKETREAFVLLWWWLSFTFFVLFIVLLLFLFQLIPWLPPLLFNREQTRPF